MDQLQVAKPPGPQWLHRLLVAVAGCYLAAIFLGSLGSSLPRDLLPRSFLYFTQVACLFPHAATHTIEYRAAGFSCKEGKFQELDDREYFPIHADDKESRFHRVGHFYRSNHTVMAALDRHLVQRHNEHVERGNEATDGIEGRIGGILVMSLRIPLPAPGTVAPRFTRTPLLEIPRDWRKAWYRTPETRRREVCGIQHD